MPYTKEQIISLLRDCKKDPLMSYNIDYWDRKTKDPYVWKVVYMGPKNTPYEGGLFNIIADFPENYPDKGPKMRFVNKMYHCNIDAQGNICISTLSKWKPKSNMSEVLPIIFALFFMQNPDSAFDSRKSNLYKTNRAEFDKNAREYTQKYANPSNPCM